MSSAADIMASNPAAAGSSRLAVTAAGAGAGAGGTADPLENTRAIFTTFGMIITHCDGIINESWHANIKQATGFTLLVP